VHTSLAGFFKLDIRTALGGEVILRPRVMCAGDSTKRTLCDTVVNVHESVKDMCYGTKDSFYEELQHAFDKFPKPHMKILIEDFIKICGGKVYSN
jgi:hypothetical protein